MQIGFRLLRCAAFMSVEPNIAFDRLPTPIAQALVERGFTSLTPVQERVLDPALEGCDLRIASQTGSGKTVAVGFILAPGLVQVAEAHAASPAARGPAQPFALIIAPTRELAAQLGRELSWLYAKLRIGVAVVAGGASYRDEMRALSKRPLVVVGTPGRLKDHLERGSIDTTFIGRVVLDEADQMLDLGFRDELDAILGMLPAERRTHLMSATFPRDVLELANRYQRDAVLVEGTGLGHANSDITHVAHLVHNNERESALINLLLMAPGERTLVFVRTRADATDLSGRLTRAGFFALPLSGELAQADRNKTLEAFRAGAVSTLVATDVAARGLDIPDVGRVIHVDPPNDRENLTHRSGRTGRAGRKGTSIVLASPGARSRVMEIFRGARVEVTWSPIPTAKDIFRAADDRLSASLAVAVTDAIDPRLDALADRLLAELEVKDLVRLLLARSGQGGPCAPRQVTPVAPRPEKRSQAPKSRAPEHYVSFSINYGEALGADKRRLLAMVCRRGNVTGDQIGAIRIEKRHAVFDVAVTSAEKFARAVKKEDRRNPEFVVTPHDPHAQQETTTAPAPSLKKTAPKHVRKARPKEKDHRARPRVAAGLAEGVT
jgi:ATP-dependent RNA helicase DeaD